MSSATLFAMAACVLVGAGLYGLIVHPHPLRKILSFNILGSGVFLLFGVIARRGAAAGFGGDPIPQGLVITGLIVAFSATALAVASAAAAVRGQRVGVVVVGSAARGHRRRQHAERREPECRLRCCHSISPRPAVTCWCWP